MKKFILAWDDDNSLIGVYINPDYIIKLGKVYKYYNKARDRYWIEVDCGDQSIQYYIDENTYNNLVNMER